MKIFYIEISPFVFWTVEANDSKELEYPQEPQAEEKKR